jgi:HEAT repeat protein
MDLAHASVDELYALARSSQDEESYWAVVSELHTRVNDHTFRIADVLCDSLAVGERCLGADVLGQLGAAEGASPAEGPFASAAGRVLLRLLEEDDEPAVLSSAAIGLGHLRDERAIDRLAALVAHASPEVRRSVVHGLMGYDDDRAVHALVRLSQDEVASVRDWATFALGVQIDRDTPELREALAARLGDEDANTRDEAIRGLALRGDARAIEAALAAEPTPEIEEAIAILAEATGDPRLRERLEAHPSTES